MKVYLVNAFAEGTFSGNPAGVCILPSAKDEQWMQKVAAEINLSETAFLTKRDEGFDLRWFTPKKEVDLCGHATLASAYILWETGLLKSEEKALFITKSGSLTASRKEDSVELDFPAEEEKEAPSPPGLLEGLKVKPLYVGKNRMDYIVEVEAEKEVRNLNPDFELLKQVETRGVIVTSRAAMPGYDFVSRFFAPAYGIYEDPVTGSAHCCLGPYWKKKLKKNEFVALQLSERGGVLRVRVDKDRVFLAGKAVRVSCMELTELS